MNSPEEKLLRLIRGAAPAKTAPLPQAKNLGTAASASTKQVAFSLRINQPFLFAQRLLPHTLIALFVVSVAYLLASLFFPSFGFYSLTKDRLLNVEGGSEQAPARKAVIRPLEAYAKAFEQRNIFSGTSSYQVNVPTAAAQFTLSKDITVVGIISGESPQAIIEDKATGKTSYVRPGMFIGEYQVEAIQEGKVILSSEGKRFELYL